MISDERKFLGIMSISTVPLKMVQGPDDIHFIVWGRPIGKINRYLFEQLEPIEICQLLKIPWER